MRDSQTRSRSTRRTRSETGNEVESRPEGEEKTRSNKRRDTRSDDNHATPAETGRHHHRLIDLDQIGRQPPDRKRRERSATDHEVRASTRRGQRRNPKSNTRSFDQMKKRKGEPETRYAEISTTTVTGSNRHRSPESVLRYHHIER